MSALPCSPLIFIDDYLAGEESAEHRHEYVGGIIHMIAGAKNRHQRIASRALIGLGKRLPAGPCEALDSNTKVRIRSTDEVCFYYPDAMVVCEGNPDSDVFQDQPVVIVEVLSESTRRHDLGEKRDACLTIPSLQVLLLLEQDEVLVSVDRRGADGAFARTWIDDVNAAIDLPTLGIDLPLRDLYAA